MKKPTSKKPSSKKPAGAKPSLLQVIINALEDLKAQNIVTLDVTRLTDVTDTLIIASGSSSRQVRALAQHAVEEAKKQGMPSIGIEGLDGGEWVLADFGDVVLHVMQPDVREFYDLEKLWQSTESKTAPVTQAAPAPKAAPATKPAAKKPAVAKKADVKTAPAPVIEFTTQSDAAKARKAPGKPKAAPSSAASPKKPAAKTAPVKAGIYAKTGTKKPAAKKPATCEKTSYGCEKTGYGCEKIDNGCNKTCRYEKTYSGREKTSGSRQKNSRT
jgi:ribosome-associated protein